MFVLWFVWNARVSCTVLLFACLLRESCAVYSLICFLFVTQEFYALFVLWIVCYPRVSCTVRSLDCLFVSQESRARSVLWIVCLQCKSLVHCSFSRLFVCYPRVSCTVCSLDCYPRVSCTVRSLDCLFVSQGSWALFVLWIVCLLCKSLAHCLFSKSLVHCLFSGLFVCYVRVSCTVFSPGFFIIFTHKSLFSCTVCSLDCLFVTRESRALSVLWIVCLQCKSLVHYFFSGLFVCYARVSCTVFSPGFFIIFTHKSLF